MLNVVVWRWPDCVTRVANEMDVQLIVGRYDFLLLPAEDRRNRKPCCEIFSWQAIYLSRGHLTYAILYGILGTMRLCGAHPGLAVFIDLFISLLMFKRSMPS